MQKFAPELFSKVGKVSVIFIFTVLAAIAAYGWTQVSVDFEITFFLTDPEMETYKYFKLAKEYNEIGVAGQDITFFTNSTTLDYFSEEVQLTTI